MPGPQTLLHLDALVLELPNGLIRAPMNLTIPTGVTLVCGDEGTGKSTLLRTLAQAATTEVFLMDPADRSVDEVGVRAYWQAQAKRYSAWREDVLQDLTQALGLAPHLDKSFFMLSTGSRRKVMLAASIASGAPLVLWDQPFASLDLASIQVLHGVLKAAQAQERAFVLADYLPPEGVNLANTINLDLS